MKLIVYEYTYVSIAVHEIMVMAVSPRMDNAWKFRCTQKSGKLWAEIDWCFIEP